MQSYSSCRLDSSRHRADFVPLTLLVALQLQFTPGASLLFMRGERRRRVISSRAPNQPRPEQRSNRPEEAGWCGSEDEEMKCYDSLVSYYLH